MTPWTPDVSLDDETAHRLLTERFPDLRPLTVKFLGAGWDNHAYLVDDSWVFRIPHRQLGGELMEIECGVLEYLNRFELPLPIPAPKFVAGPDKTFPYPISGYPLIVGRTADAVDWTSDERAKNAAPLGHFLSKLHRIPSDVSVALGDTLRRADIPYRMPKLRESLANAPRRISDLMEDLANTPLAESFTWVHGDLYSRHLIVNSDQDLCGVIDFGDVHVGDPALDISIAWMFLPFSSWTAFTEAYGGIDENTWRRARFRAVGHWLYLSRYADAERDERLKGELDFVLSNVLTGA